MKSSLAVLSLLFAASTLFAENYKLIGDFEKTDSFLCSWQAPYGVWSVTGNGKNSAVRSEKHVKNGHFSLQWNVEGRKTAYWPYIQYRLPRNAQDLSKYKTITMRVFNPGKKQIIFIRVETKGLELKDKLIGMVETRWIQPGENTLTFALGHATGLVRGKTDKAKMDWTKTDSITFYFNAPKETFKLFIDDIYLGKKPEVKKKR